MHRDLKPENILIESDTKRVKVIDFGLSKKQINKAERMRSEVGTWYYSSPEVDEGEYTEKCDIWSVGVILHLMLSGRLPFYAAATSDLIKLKKKKELSFGGFRWNKISDNAKDFVRMCLCKREKQRMTAVQAEGMRGLGGYAGGM